MPAYNEAERIEQTIGTIAAYGQARGHVYPVVLADDGSTDSTIERARSAAAAAGLPLTILSFPHRGKAATVRDGMLALADDERVDYLMMLDADDEVRVDELDHAAWTGDPHTIYIARRIGETAGSVGRPSPFRRTMSAGMRLASRTLLGLDYPDTQCGFKLFPRPLAGAIFRQQRSTAWVFDAELLVIANRVSGLAVLEIPVRWQPRGGSKVTRSAAVTSVIGLLGIAWRYWSGVYEPVAERPVAVAPERARA
jgi:glycosyltransferase involved in cell wall biosynthesis